MAFIWHVFNYLLNCNRFEKWTQIPFDVLVSYLFGLVLNLLVTSPFANLLNIYIKPNKNTKLSVHKNEHKL